MISYYSVLIWFALFVPSCSEFESRDGRYCLEVQGRPVKPVKGQGKHPTGVHEFDLVAVLLKFHILSLGVWRELIRW